MTGRRATAFVGAWVLVAWTVAALAADIDEFKVKRQEVFEFTAKPTVARDATTQPDRFVIRFASKGFCDATVAIEDAQGKIVRHLASGVLGSKAPEPFQKDSLAQTVVWDGKDDQGRYVDNLAGFSVRVSLGLKPVFERTLFWSPHKRTGGIPVMAAAPEGVYVFEAEAPDSVRLYDHDGNYLRTIYPFPGDKLAEVKGLNVKEFPQDGQRLPVKVGFTRRSTLLMGSQHQHQTSGSALAVQGARLAIPGSCSFNRLATDGTSGGLPLDGPAVSLEVVLEGKATKVPPRSAAFSPDGRRVYLTGYHFGAYEWLHCVTYLDYAGDGKMELFAGSMRQEHSRSGDQTFKVPAGVAVDAQGRVYVADFMNDRIQVYSAEAKLLKSIPVKHPNQIAVHPKTGEIYVGSWMLHNHFITADDYKVPATFTRLGPLDNPEVKATYPLPLNSYEPTMKNWFSWDAYRMAVDSWAERVTLWVIPGTIARYGFLETKSDLRGTGMLLLQEQDGKLVVKRDFNDDVVNNKAVVRATPLALARQRLYVSPVDGILYVAEGDCACAKGVTQLVRIDPETAKVKLVELPMSTDDVAIDLDGYFYLRSDRAVPRYDPVTWREIPWDYGEEMTGEGMVDSHGRTTSFVSGLHVPGTGRASGWWHLGGMGISPKGHLAVTTANFWRPEDRRDNPLVPYTQKAMAGHKPAVSKYTPRLYPGRQTGFETHVFDKHGRFVYQDATPGIYVTDGMGIDKDDNLYFLAHQDRILDGKPYLLPWAETYVKVKAGKMRTLSSGNCPVPLERGAQPKRPPDMTAGTGNVWVEGAEWFYGGVGFHGWGAERCICWNARPALDLFARSFLTEVNHFSVAVLDTNGNLIMRIGKYGNVDDGKPLIPDGGPKTPRSIGGDEVAIFQADYVGTHTDRRLFIADTGNFRILSVKLGYHAEEKVALKEK